MSLSMFPAEFPSRKFCYVCHIRPCCCSGSLCWYDVPSLAQRHHHHSSSNPSSNSFQSSTSFNGCHYNPLTASIRWKQRRQSVRELRQHESAVKSEYDRLRQMEKDMRSLEPPQYETGMSSSGESVFGMNADGMRVTIPMGSQGRERDSRWDNRTTYRVLY